MSSSAAVTISSTAETSSALTPVSALIAIASFSLS